MREITVGGIVYSCAYMMNDTPLFLLSMASKDIIIIIIASIIIHIHISAYPKFLGCQK